MGKSRNSRRLHCDNNTARMTSHIPSPLLWELTKNRSAYTVKRRTGGGVQFSTDPLNVLGRHTRKQDGYIQDKAIGVVPSPNGGVTLLTKKSGKSNKPASSPRPSAPSPPPAATTARSSTRPLAASTALICVRWLSSVRAPLARVRSRRVRSMLLS